MGTLNPKCLSIAAYLFTNVEPSIQRAIGHLEPVIQDRLDKEEQYGTRDWPGKPVSLVYSDVKSLSLTILDLQNDLISWLLDEAQGPQRSIRELTLRILTVNFAAIHTTSMVKCSTSLVIDRRAKQGPEGVYPGTL